MLELIGEILLHIMRALLWGIVGAVVSLSYTPKSSAWAGCRWAVVVTGALAIIGGIAVFVGRWVEASSETLWLSFEVASASLVTCLILGNVYLKCHETPKPAAVKESSSEETS